MQTIYSNTDNGLIIYKSFLEAIPDNTVLLFETAVQKFRIEIDFEIEDYPTCSLLFFEQVDLNRFKGTGTVYLISDDEILYSEKITIV